MDELISKKELLQVTGISYGQLYRWKRKNIIPEEWFIKKSSYTGQETFFPREKILNRIRQIIDMKEDVSLDDLAERFSPSIPEKLEISLDELKSRNIVSKEIISVYCDIFKERKAFGFEDLLYMDIAQDLLEKGSLTLDDMEKIILMLSKGYEGMKDKDPSLTVFRRLGITLSLLHRHDAIYMSSTDAIIANYSIRNAVENLKKKII